MSTRNDILMPKLGLTMTEGMIADWAVRPGDTVQPGQLMFVVETEKVATEVPAPSAGEILEILVQTGDTVPVGTVVARWTGSGQPATESDTAPAPQVAASAAEQGNGHGQANATASTAMPASHQEVQPQHQEQPQQSTQQSYLQPQLQQRAPQHGPKQLPQHQQPPHTESHSHPHSHPSGRILSSPYARRLALEHGISLAQVLGTGPRGRIKAQDVREAVDQLATRPVSRPTQHATFSSRPSGPSTGQPMAASSIVAAMAKRMVQAKQEVPHFYLSTEVEVSALLDLRTTLNAQPGFAKLTLNHFLIAAVARALEDCPFQNRIWMQDQILQFDGVDVGVAVSTDRGLMAPVLHAVQGCSLETIAQRANELISRVRTGQVRREEMSGGAITISNAGMFNVTYMTPIINPPQSAILGVGSVREVFRPSANGQPTLKREMGLVLACDHRLHDGTSGLKFLNVVVEYLQHPVWLLRSL